MSNTINENSNTLYSGPERRLSGTPRRTYSHRRHRVRNESLVTDCRLLIYRRREDEEGFVEVPSLYDEENQDLISPTH